MLYDDPSKDPAVIRLFAMEQTIDADLARIIPDPVAKWTHANATTLLVLTTTKRLFVVEARRRGGYRVTEKDLSAHLEGRA